MFLKQASGMNARMKGCTNSPSISSVRLELSGSACKSSWSYLLSVIYTSQYSALVVKVDISFKL